jgi:hypothetical protein
MAAAWRCRASFSTLERAWFMATILPATRYALVTEARANT